MKFDENVQTLKENYLQPTGGGLGMQGSVQMKHSKTGGKPSSTATPDQTQTDELDDDAGILKSLIMRATEEDDDGIIDELDGYFNGIGLNDKTKFGSNLLKLAAKWGSGNA